MTSDQTLSESDRRTLATWAAGCARHVLDLVDADEATTVLIRDAVDRAEAFGSGQSAAAAEIRQRMVAVKAAGAVRTEAGAAAARSAAQAAAVAHMGAHALGAAAYAVKAASLARTDGGEDELSWQLQQLPSDARAALLLLPDVPADTSGPLGPGLLSTGSLGDTVRAIQRAIRD